MKKVIQLQGLDCAACAAKLERQIAKIDGVKQATIVFVTQKLNVEYNNDKTLKKIIDTVTSFEEVEIVENEEVQTSKKLEWIRIGISVLLFLIGLACKTIDGIFAVIGFVSYIAAYITVGFSVFKSTIKNIRKGKVFDENFLMTVASIGAIALGELSEAVLVMLLYQIGETLQSIAVGASRRSISELMDLKSESATLLKNGEYIQVQPETLQEDDIIVVKTGEKNPVDGILVSEQAILDTKSLTGESAYRTLVKGEEMLSGCINVGGMYEMKVLRRYQNSAVSKILELVENAPSNKAESEKFISKFAKYYTPIVCCFALAVAFVLPLLSSITAGDGLYFKDFGRWVHSALTFLVVSCPCALVISVPLTYFSGIGTCAKHGVLVKGATHLDVAAKVKIVAFDKTGTLTGGAFSVCEVCTENGISEEEFLSIASAVEKGSAHPIAKAFCEYSTTLKAENLVENIGRGLKAEIEKSEIVIGTHVFLRENGICSPDIQGPYTFIHLAKDKKYLGYVKLGDKIRSEAKETVSKLREMGIERIVMLTGDNDERAYKIANGAGMYEVNSKLMPDQKLQKAKELKQDGVLMYVGDGVNDAPVMTVADCAVSMGTLGSAAAVEASDLVLISDNLNSLPMAIKIARKTNNIVVQNIIFSIIMKLVFMILGLLGVLPLGLAVFADVGVMLLAVLNSFRVRRIRK